MCLGSMDSLPNLLQYKSLIGSAGAIRHFSGLPLLSTLSFLALAHLLRYLASIRPEIWVPLTSLWTKQNSYQWYWKQSCMVRHSLMVNREESILNIYCARFLIVDVWRDDLDPSVSTVH